MSEDAGWDNPSMPGQKTGKGILREIQDLENSINRPRVPIGSGVVTVKPYDKDEAELTEKINALSMYRNKLPVEMGMRTMFSVPHPVDTNDLIKWAENREAAKEKIHLYEFLTSFIAHHNNSPDIVKYVHEFFPEYFEERAEEITYTTELQKRLALIANDIVPKTRDDFLLLYAIAKGRISIPTHSVLQPKSGVAKDEMKRGLFSVKNNKTTPNMLGGNFLKDMNSPDAITQLAATDRTAASNIATDVEMKDGRRNFFDSNKVGRKSIFG